MGETRGTGDMGEVLEVLRDWDLVTDELAARSIATDAAWTVLQLVAQNRVAAALERLTGIQGGQLNRDTLTDIYTVRSSSAPTGVMSATSLALVVDARERVRLLRATTSGSLDERLMSIEFLLTRALGDDGEVDPDEDPRR